MKKCQPHICLITDAAIFTTFEVNTVKFLCSQTKSVCAGVWCVWSGKVNIGHELARLLEQAKRRCYCLSAAPGTL